MTGSKLVSYYCQSPNHSTGRGGQKVWIITPHCVVGQLDVVTLGNIFKPTSRKASSTYGIGRDGRIAQYVDEADKPWTTSSKWNDQRAITVEVANDKDPPGKMNDAAVDALVELAADCCVRYGKKRLVWPGSLKALQNTAWPSDTMVLSAHRWFDNTSCPGDWFYAREAEFADRVTKRIEELTDDMTEEKVKAIVEAVLAEQAKTRKTASVPEWAKAEFGMAMDSGITDGSRPQDYCTRLEAAIMVQRAMERQD